MRDAEIMDEIRRLRRRVLLDVGIAVERTRLFFEPRNPELEAALGELLRQLGRVADADE